MQIIAKSAFDESQINAKLDAGCDGIEIRLLDDFFTNIGERSKSCASVLTHLPIGKYKVTAVHTPLLKSDVTLEDYLFKNTDALYQIYDFANYLGKKQDKSLILILHMNSSSDDILGNGAMWLKVLDVFGDLLRRGSFVDIAIENVTPVRNHMGHLTLCNNFEFDNVRVVKALREKLKTDRIGTVLDICNAKMSIEYLHDIYAKLGLQESACSLRDYFMLNGPVVKLIHFADYIGSGYGPNQHGTVPNTDATNEFVKLYEQYNYTCPVTIEVYEDDYLVNRNYSLTKLQLNAALKEHEYLKTTF